MFITFKNVTELTSKSHIEEQSWKSVLRNMDGSMGVFNKYMTGRD